METVGRNGIPKTLMKPMLRHRDPEHEAGQGSSGTQITCILQLLLGRLLTIIQTTRLCYGI